MLIYYLIFFSAFVILILNAPKGHFTDLVLWRVFLLLLIFAIGLRHEVGGDWVNYAFNNSDYRNLLTQDFFNIFNRRNFTENDIGFIVVHWIGQNWGNGIHTTNFLCAIIFVYGLFRFLDYTKHKWLGLLISIPYLVTVVSMGYTRQAVAIGIVMLAYISLTNDDKKNFYIKIILASLFHKTAIVLLVTGLLYRSERINKFRFYEYIFIFCGIISVPLFMEIFEQKIKYFILNPIAESEGVWFRLAPLIFSGMIYFFSSTKWRILHKDGNLWSVIFFQLIILSLFANHFSSMVDRIALYFLPLQLVVLSRIPFLFSNNVLILKEFGLMSIAFIMFLMLFVWIQFGTYSVYWIPYKNFIFEFLSPFEYFSPLT